MDGYYSLPAGHVDGNESARQAAIREAKEEVNIDLTPRDLELIHTMHRKATEGDHERMDLFFKVNKWNGNPKNVEPQKCDELSWYLVDSLPENIVPEVKFSLNKVNNNESYSDFNF